MEERQFKDKNGNTCIQTEDGSIYMLRIEFYSRTTEEVMNDIFPDWAEKKQHKAFLDKIEDRLP